jgi:nitrogen fixation protein NifZ
MISNAGRTRFGTERRDPASRVGGASPTRSFELGDGVRATRPLRNDGTYLHKDVGEVLVLEGDIGFVVEIALFRGEAYYTIEFVDRAVVMAARGRDLARLDDASST